MDLAKEMEMDGASDVAAGGNSASVVVFQINQWWSRLQAFPLWAPLVFSTVLLNSSLVHIIKVKQSFWEVLGADESG